MCIRDRNYPALKAQCQNSNTFSQEKNNSVPVEACCFPKIKQKEYQAVNAAIEDTLKYKDGAERMKVIPVSYTHLDVYKRQLQAESSALSLVY